MRTQKMTFSYGEDLARFRRFVNGSQRICTHSGYRTKAEKSDLLCNNTP
jgi:hypothetical protein